MLIDLTGLIINKLEKNYVNVNSRQREKERDRDRKKKQLSEKKDIREKDRQKDVAKR